jgi:hypothetical protein
MLSGMLSGRAGLMPPASSALALDRVRTHDVFTESAVIHVIQRDQAFGIDLKSVPTGRTLNTDAAYLVDDHAKAVHIAFPGQRASFHALGR